MEIKLFLNTHIEPVIQYEMSKFPSDWNDIQKEMESWQHPWRKESLQHYCDLGWSFVAEENDVLKGYILGQPLLFFNNWTQSLWVEDLSFDNEEIGFQLMDTAIKWSKTKHLQKVIFNTKSSKTGFVKESFPKFNDQSYLHLSTTKLEEN